MSTKKGPGRKHYSKRNPAGTKLIKRFIKDARGEAHDYRRMLARLLTERAAVSAGAQKERT